MRPLAALKKGYIDDVEFALGKGGVMVRSGSRVGQTDFGAPCMLTGTARLSCWVRLAGPP